MIRYLGSAMRLQGTIDLWFAKKEFCHQITNTYLVNPFSPSPCDGLLLVSLRISYSQILLRWIGIPFRQDSIFPGILAGRSAASTKVAHGNCSKGPCIHRWEISSYPQPTGSHPSNPAPLSTSQSAREFISSVDSLPIFQSLA